MLGWISMLGESIVERKGTTYLWRQSASSCSHPVLRYKCPCKGLTPGPTSSSETVNKFKNQMASAPSDLVLYLEGVGTDFSFVLLWAIMIRPPSPWTRGAVSWNEPRHQAAIALIGLNGRYTADLRRVLEPTMRLEGSHQIKGQTADCQEEEPRSIFQVGIQYFHFV